jgi:hypothetical protein
MALSGQLPALSLINEPRVYIYVCPLRVRVRVSGRAAVVHPHLNTYGRRPECNAKAQRTTRNTHFARRREVEVIVEDYGGVRAALRLRLMDEE